MKCELQYLNGYQDPETDFIFIKSDTNTISREFDPTGQLYVSAGNSMTSRSIDALLIMSISDSDNVAKIPCVRFGGLLTDLDAAVQAYNAIGNHDLSDLVICYDDLGRFALRSTEINDYLFKSKNFTDPIGGISFPRLQQIGEYQGNVPLIWFSAGKVGICYENGKLVVSRRSWTDEYGYGLLYEGYVFMAQYLGSNASYYPGVIKENGKYSDQVGLRSDATRIVDLAEKVEVLDYTSKTNYVCR